MKKTLFLFLLSWITTFAYAQSGQFRELEYKTSTQSLPYVVYEPTHAKGKRPLIVYLHGAISRPAVSPKPIESAKKSPFTQLADELGCYVLYPYGNKNATWFDSVGVKMVLSEIEIIKRHYPIDSDKVFLSGFSDGASGTLYFATTQSTPFAGFIALNGSVSVAATLGNSPVYLENMNGKGLYIVNTQSDMLYPVSMMLPTIEKIKQYNPNTTFRSPEGNHEMSYFPNLRSEISNFISTHQRTITDSLSYETADTLSNRYAWLSITALDSTKSPQSWHTPYSLKMSNDKASFGLMPDVKYTGDEMRVAGFGKNSLAKQMGVQVGDLITQMEDSVLHGPMTSFAYLASKKAGQNTSLTLLRNGEKIVLQGQFPPPYSYEVFTKRPLSGKVKASIKGKNIVIETSRIASFAIDFSQLPFKKGKKISLTINGKTQTVKAQGTQTFSVL